LEYYNIVSSNAMNVKRHDCEETENVLATPKARMSVFEDEVFFTWPHRAQWRGTKRFKLTENVMEGGCRRNRKVMRAPWVSVETFG
jgi:hypothetical protein